MKSLKEITVIAYCLLLFKLFLIHKFLHTATVFPTSDMTSNTEITPNPAE